MHHRLRAALTAIVASASIATPATATAYAAAASASATRSVVVRERPGHEDAAERAVSSLGGHVDQRIALIDAIVVDLPADQVSTLAHDPAVLAVTPNSRVQLLSEQGQSGDEYGSNNSGAGDNGLMSAVTSRTGARDYWNAGITGAGVDVALIDSGVSPVRGQGTLVNGPDLSFESQASNLTHLDTYGHGTHMASLIAGHDRGTSDQEGTSSQSSNFSGMAPGSRIVSLKVADAHGATDVSQLLAAIDWVVQHRNTNGLNIRVLNLSFGTASGQDYSVDPLAFAAEAAWRNGICVVVSGGNQGYDAQGLSDPAYDPYLIAVGASANTESTDVVAGFSSGGDGTRNPDLLAPGAHIVGLRDPGSYIDQHYGSTGRVGTRFFRGSGTSQAAAITSGAAALLIQQHPRITPDGVKALLTSTATPIGSDPRLAGAGEINLAGALGAQVPGGTQSFTPSTGIGSVELSRGGTHVSLGGSSDLTGEQDIFGNNIDTAALAQAEANGRAWSGGNWNGVTWTSTSSRGQSWKGVTWSGVTWSGRSWSGVTWSNLTWNGVTWSAGSWDSRNWCGVTWSGVTWSTSTWN